MALNEIIIGDCLEMLPTLPAASVELVVTDPPYNIGLDYPGHDDNLPADHRSSRDLLSNSGRR